MSEGAEPPPIQPVDDPFAPDAPIYHLLSLKHNPLLKDATDDELRSIVQRLRTYATSAPSLTAKLERDSSNVPARKRRTDSASAKRKALLAEL